MPRLADRAGRPPYESPHHQPAEFRCSTRERAAGWLARIADYVELTKPRIVALELVTVIVAAHLASPWGVDPGCCCTRCSAPRSWPPAPARSTNGGNEQPTPGWRAPPTARCPPAGSRRGKSLLFGSLTLARRHRSSCLVFVNSPRPRVALATWLIYVFAYTPLKTRSPLNTAVGAVSGALPILIGWTATGAADRHARRWHSSAVMFLWQFPHFMAIAWLYRADYARAGQQMLTVVDPTGLRAGAQAVVGALALIPVSLVPALVAARRQPGHLLRLGHRCSASASCVAATLFLLHRNDRIRPPAAAGQPGVPDLLDGTTAADGRRLTP